jgi:tetratricopeptide (TPR) repeat protein
MEDFMHLSGATTRFFTTAFLATVFLTQAGIPAHSGMAAEIGAAEIPVVHARGDWNRTHVAAMEADKAGRHEEARKLFLESWDEALTPEQKAVSAEEIGFDLHRKGRDREAKEWIEKARVQCLADPGASPHLAPVDSILADIARDAGDYPAAERFWRAALAEHPDTDGKMAVAQIGLADLLREQGNVGEAAALFKRTLALTNISPRQRMDSLLGLADIDRGTGAWEASADEWNKAIETARTQGDVISEGVALRGLGDTWLDAGVPARAEPLLRRSLSIFEADPASPPEQTATVLKSLAGLYSIENKLALAEEALSKALSVDRRVLGETHPQVAQLMENLAWVYSARGEIEMARDLASRACTVMFATFGADSLPVAGALASRAFVEAAAKDLKAAAADYAQALSIARQHPDYQKIELGLIQRYREVLKALHRNDEVVALNAEARLISNNLKVSPLR